MGAIFPPARAIERLVDQNVRTNNQLIYVAFISVFSLSPALDAFTITPLVDDVAYACRIVLNADSFGWSDLGWSVMFVWHLLLALFLTYAAAMTTYAMCARPGLAGPTRIVRKLDELGGVSLALGSSVLATVTTIVVGLLYYDRDGIGVMEQSRRLIRIVFEQEDSSEHWWTATLVAIFQAGGPGIMVLLFLELTAATCALWARIAWRRPVVGGTLASRNSGIGKAGCARLNRGWELGDVVTAHNGSLHHPEEFVLVFARP